MACFNKCVHIVALTLILCTGLTSYIYIDTRTNTSFKIASAHLVALYNFGCAKANGSLWYIQIADDQAITVLDQVGDNIYGLTSASDIAVYSVATNKLVANQIYQYTTRLPRSDQVGLYFTDCTILPTDAVDQMSVAAAMSLIVVLLIFIAYVVSYHYIYKQCRDPYVELA